MQKKFVATAALAALSASLVAAGCNGDNNGGPGPVPAPIFTATPGATTGATPGVTPGATARPTVRPTAGPTAAPTTVPAQSFAAPIRFPNGQNGTLNLRVAGTSVTGNVVVRALGVARLQQTSFAIAAGTYPISGTFTPPRGFTVRGSFPAPIGSFTISGTLPTATQAGAYTLTAGGQTVSGIVPVPGATPTPAPTQPGGGSGALVLSPGAGFNGLNSPIDSTTNQRALLDLRGADTFDANIGVGERVLQFTGRPLNADIAQGTSLVVRSIPDVAQMGGIVISYNEGRVQNGTYFAGFWNATSGSVAFESIVGSRLTLRLQNVGFTPLANTETRGTFTLNGTFTFTNVVRP